jgi:hypothetical protein
MGIDSEKAVKRAASKSRSRGRSKSAKAEQREAGVKRKRLVLLFLPSYLWCYCGLRLFGEVCSPVLTIAQRGRFQPCRWTQRRNTEEESKEAGAQAAVRQEQGCTTWRGRQRDSDEDAQASLRWQARRRQDRLPIVTLWSSSIIVNYNFSTLFA